MYKILFITTFLGINVFSQDIKVSVGDAFKAYSGESDVLGVQDGNTITANYSYIFRGGRKPDVFINVLDGRMNVISTKEVFTIERADDIIKIFYSDQIYHVFFQRFNTDNKTSTLYAGQLDDKYNVASNIKEISTVNYASSTDGKKPFSIKYSLDSSKYIVGCYNAAEQYLMTVLQVDKEFETILKINSVPLSYDYVLKEEGDLFFLMNNTLYFYNEEIETPSAIAPDKSLGLQVVDSKFIYDKEADMLYYIGVVFDKSAGSFEYSNGFSDYSTGYVWMKIDCETKEILASNTYNYPENVLSSFIDNHPDSRSNDKLWLNHLSLIELDKTGNVFLSLRASHVFVNDLSNTPVKQLKSRGVLIVSLDENGAIHWHKSFDSFQTSLDGESFEELAFPLSDKMAYVNTDQLSHDKLIIEVFDSDGTTIKSKGLVINKNRVFLSRNNYIQNRHVIVNGFQRSGLFKVSSYFMEIKF